jgi:hypothetical protein
MAEYLFRAVIAKPWESYTNATVNEQNTPDNQATAGAEGGTPVQTAEITNSEENCKPATQQQLAEVRSDLSSFERATLRWTRTTAGIGLATAIFICLQWCEMRSGSTDTHNLALAAKLDQRAWVGFAVLTLETPKVGDVAHASVTYFNTGRTPAKNVHSLTRLKFSPELISSEAELLNLSKEGGSPAPILSVMYPGMPYPVPIDGRDKFSEADVTPIGNWYTYLWGEVAYTDAFDEPHLMEFCAYRKGLTGGFLHCSFHNQPDYQKNPN